MNGISPVAGSGTYFAYFHPSLQKTINIPYNNIPHNNIPSHSSNNHSNKPLTHIPANQPGNTDINNRLSWTINSFRSILEFFINTAENTQHQRASDNYCNNNEIQIKCRTCSTREYVCSNGETSDGKTVIISGHESIEKVRQHEAEHLRIARLRAATQGKMVVAQWINITTAQCPECGETYVTKGEAVSKMIDIGSPSRISYHYSNYPYGPDERLEGKGLHIDMYS
jgi:predicted RNA-binding Zn-ribbon protein involved in translation (DUF1610 family)